MVKSCCSKPIFKHFASGDEALLGDMYLDLLLDLTVIRRQSIAQHYQVPISRCLAVTGSGSDGQCRRSDFWAHCDIVIRT